ncbi:amino acid exporter (AAE family) [Orbus hercynius]|uniref:Amino acid exporter (AAE family) n=1 Tax=Orbus hercynius TaxID=593135 RepID=A0A495RCE6_9GAMM|nr:L-methionine/branched-chain amino acid transporter [Orbus hercynius]RKS85147.1 amino acid exporter (AAE family) [Orbus hercynius]
MSELKKELNFWQGIGLLSTSLLGTGIFAVPAIVAQIAGQDGLWAWPLLLVLVFPIAIIFAELGKHYPSAGGVAYFIAKAFNPVLGRVTAWSFLSVIPFGLPAGLYIASGFWASVFHVTAEVELMIQVVTLLLIWAIGLFGAAASGWVQSIIAILIISLVMAMCFFSSPSVLTVTWPNICDVQFMPVINALAVMFWCFVGLEAFVHLSTEFKHPQKDFPRALLMGLILAGFIYWVCTAAVIFFVPNLSSATAALPTIIEQLFGAKALWLFCLIGYLACFASINIYCQSFARLVWVQANENHPQGRLARLSKRQTPVNALTLVILLSMFFLLLIHLFTFSLHSLLEYANGVFVFIYFLAMLSAIKLLSGKLRILASVCTMICLGLLCVIGYKSLYALGIFIILWFIAKKVTVIKTSNP